MTPYRIAYLLLTIGVSPPLSVLIESGDIPRIPAIMLPPMLMAAVAILAEMCANVAAKVLAVNSRVDTMQAAVTGQIPAAPTKPE